MDLLVVSHTSFLKSELWTYTDPSHYKTVLCSQRRRVVQRSPVSVSGQIVLTSSYRWWQTTNRRCSIPWRVLYFVCVTKERRKGLSQKGLSVTCSADVWCGLHRDWDVGTWGLTMMSRTVYHPRSTMTNTLSIKVLTQLEILLVTSWVRKKPSHLEERGVVISERRELRKKSFYIIV